MVQGLQKARWGGGGNQGTRAKESSLSNRRDPPVVWRCHHQQMWTREGGDRACLAQHGAVAIHGNIVAGKVEEILTSLSPSLEPLLPGIPESPGGTWNSSCTRLYRIPILTIPFSWRLPSSDGPEVRPGWFHLEILTPTLTISNARSS